MALGSSAAAAAAGSEHPAAFAAPGFAFQALAALAPLHVACVVASSSAAAADDDDLPPAWVALWACCFASDFLEGHPGGFPDHYSP